jgi:hypothetical protein
MRLRPKVWTLASWRIVLGLLLAFSSLLFPWLGLSLSPSLSSWNLTMALGSMPLIGHLTYGELVAALAVTASVSAVRSRGRPTNTTRACGWAMLATPVFFFLTTRLIGSELLFRLTSDNLQTEIVDRQIFQYHAAPPTSYFGFTPDSTTTMVLNALRIGWLLALAGGALLAGRLVNPLRHRGWTFTGLAGVSVVVAWGLTTGMLAEAAMSDGIAAAQSGHSVPAEHDFHRALTLNPQLRYDRQLNTELGQVQANQGQQGALAWFAKTASPPSGNEDIAQQILDYSRALSLAPSNPVIKNDFAVSLADDMIGTQSPVDPSVVSTLDGMPFLSLTYGHYAYEAGDDSATIQFMDRTVANSNNGELLSVAYTYLALSEQRLGHPAAFRRDIVKAVALDTQNVNGLGREVAAGLYTPGSP